jgi:uncharacterized protein
MTLVNTTKATVLASQVVIAGTVLTRLRGLLGKKEFAKGQALIIKPCNSIHTLFMRFPIDVLFADKNNHVIAAISALQPFRISRLYFNASYTVELPTGSIEATSTSPGDLLKIE